MANRIFYEGAKLLDFKVEIFGTVGLLVFVVLGPLLVFTPQLRVARRKGMEEYGNLGQQYAREFNRKWIRGDRLADETPLGSADIQSLADLRNGYQVVEGIRLTPFSMRNVICSGGDHAAAGCTASADDVLGGGIARSRAEGAVLKRPKPASASVSCSWLGVARCALAVRRCLQPVGTPPRVFQREARLADAAQAVQHALQRRAWRYCPGHDRAFGSARQAAPRGP